jgi:hypothetical protein
MSKVFIGAILFFAGGVTTVIAGTGPTPGMAADLFWAGMALSGPIAVAGLDAVE